MLDVNRILPLIFLFFISCGSLQQKKEYEIGYKIFKLKSQDKSSYLSVESYDFKDESKELRPCYRINKILFCDFQNKIENPLAVIPGEFLISTSYIGKSDIKTNRFNIAKGDSVIVKFYLGDDPEPLF